MKNTDILNVYKTCQNILQSEKESSAKFKYIILKLYNITQPIIEEFKKKELSINSISIITQFNQESMKIYEKYGEKQDNGYKLLEQNIEIANKELEALKETYKTEIDTYLKEWDNFQKEISSGETELSENIVNYKITIDMVPEWITIDDLNTLIKLDLIYYPLS